jgi:hypothetical protein
MALRISNAADLNFGEYIPVVVADTGGYKKAAGTYNIKFAISEYRSVSKTIKASISDDTPRTPPGVPAPRVVINNPPQPAPAATTPPPITIETPVPPEPEIVTETPIEPTEVPLAEPEEKGAWHLIDLLLSILTMAIGFYLMIYVMRRRDEFDEEFSSRDRQMKTWGQLGVLLGIVSVIVLLLTQDFTGDMYIADAWTALFAVIFGVNVLALLGVTSHEREEDREI